VTLRIKLFGSLELERDGQPLARFASRKSGELFAYLALNRKAPHTREHLAGVFWGDSSEERARHTLNTTLWRINRVLEPPQCSASERGYLRVTPQHIGFNAASGVWLDVAEFETRCELAEQTEAPTKYALYTQAVNLYRADLLADCYEDWCIVERERLQGLYVRALAQLMSVHSSNAEYDLAIDCARRILTCDPLREEVHRDLMRLHLQASQPAAALRQYRQCEGMLRDELGVEPAPETRAMLTPILSSSADVPSVDGIRPRTVTANQLSAVAAKIEHLSAACDAAQAQLHEAMALLRELTSELQSDPFLVPLHVVPRRSPSRDFPGGHPAERRAPGGHRPSPQPRERRAPTDDFPSGQPAASRDASGDLSSPPPRDRTAARGDCPQAAQHLELESELELELELELEKTSESKDLRGAKRSRDALAVAAVN
jgi:DNA-binding SARP family transcriptional activator